MADEAEDIAGAGEGAGAGAADIGPKARITIEAAAGDAKLSEKQLRDARKLYTKYDADGSNELDKSELNEMLKELNLRLTEEMYDKYVSRYWASTDDDVSGTINFDEFLLLYSKVVAPLNMYQTKMLKAAGRGHPDVVIDLVARGCNPNAGDGSGWTACHHAAEFGRTEVIKALQDFMGMDLDIDAPDKYGWTPLFNAAANGRIDTMKHLIKSGADLKAASTKGRTALHIAASTGHAEAAQLLIAKKASLKAVDESGWTPLFCACMHGHTSIIRSLIEAGTDIKITDQCGYTMMKYCDDDIKKFVESVLGIKSARPKSPRSPRA